MNMFQNKPKIALHLQNTVSTVTVNSTTLQYML